LVGDVVVDRVEDLGRDPLGFLAVDGGVSQGIGQGESIGQLLPSMGRRWPRSIFSSASRRWC
jgi:hypothetical protein